MFPETNVVNSTDSTDTSTDSGKSLVFDFSTGDFVLKDGKLTSVEGNEAVKAWIGKTIRTEQLRFKIYEDVDYGVTIEDLVIGSNLPLAFINSELKREILEALKKHPLIDDITNFMISRESTRIIISFEVLLVDDSFNQEVTI